MKKHLIEGVEKGSIAHEFNIEAGDLLLSVNGEEIKDYFDYEFMIRASYIEVLVEKASGEQWLLEIDKEEDEELGLIFKNGMMDEYRSCSNRCIFCFIDQLPKGMRRELYFKDDDSRLSFLHGNYVTLTNMSDDDIDRIIRYHMSPVYISFQTTNKELRCRMLGNRNAGDSLLKAEKLCRAGIEMNGQIVLCKDINDKKELERSIEDLSLYAPFLQSLSIVPVGLTKYREGLFPLQPFEKEDADIVIDLVESWQKRMFKEFGYHFVHASDEFYLLAGRKLPEAGCYDGYLQYENGVGMLRSFMDEFDEAIEYIKESRDINRGLIREVSAATGLLAYETIKKMAERLQALFPGLSFRVFPVRNEFFGERITVTGLLTGGDIVRALKGEEIGEVLLLSENMAMEEEPVLLDDMSIGEIETALQVKVDIVKSNGWEFAEKALGIKLSEL